jgi:hypothetical protein
MGVTRHQDGLLSLVAKVLRDDVAVQEPLPERWVDLIHHLDEQERRHSEARRMPSDTPLNAAVLSQDMVPVCDEDLQRLAEERGPASAEAQALVQLKTQRSQDLQVHCYRVGHIYLTGPLPDATEPASADWELIEALKRAKNG